MNNEIMFLIIAILIGGFALSGGSLYASFKAYTIDRQFRKDSEAAVGYGFLTFGLFLGTIISVSVILYNI